MFCREKEELIFRYVNSTMNYIQSTFFFLETEENCIQLNNIWQNKPEKKKKYSKLQQKFAPNLDHVSEILFSFESLQFYIK